MAKDKSSVQGDRVYQNESGRYYGAFDIAMMSMKGGKEVVRVEDGLVVDGEFFEQIEGDPPLDPSESDGSDDDSDRATDGGRELTEAEQTAKNVGPFDSFDACVNRLQQEDSVDDAEQVCGDMYQNPSKYSDG